MEKSSAVRSARQAHEATESRRDARYWRNEVMMRCGGRCEACGIFTAYITEIHHVKPVSKGGTGWPENLIALCPNCHRWITAYARWTRDIRGADVSDCIAGIYEPEIASFLCNLADSRAALDEDGRWVSWGIR